MSRTIQIPGGTAELFDKEEITPARRIDIDAMLYRSDDLIQKLAMARTITGPDGEVDENEHLNGPDYRLSHHESRTMQEMRWATAWAYLKSWTLDRPLPADWKAIMELPIDLAIAIRDGAESAPAPNPVADMQMTKDTLDDKESFTGASEKPKTRSGATAKRRTSTRTA